MVTFVGTPDAESLLGGDEPSKLKLTVKLFGNVADDDGDGDILVASQVLLLLDLFLLR